jgi:hypothetical protein
MNPELDETADKIDIRGMSDGEIYAAVSRKEAPEDHAKIDAFIEQMLNDKAKAQHSKNTDREWPTI